MSIIFSSRLQLLIMQIHTWILLHSIPRLPQLKFKTAVKIALGRASAYGWSPCRQTNSASCASGGRGRFPDRPVEIHDNYDERRVHPRYLVAHPGK
jgi:hypothetical protein